MNQRAGPPEAQNWDPPKSFRHSRPPCRSRDTACNACRRLDNVHAQINQAKELLIDLLRQREEASAAIYQAHPSIVHRMPAEVASLVFECYVEECSPLKLGAICRAWRQLAWFNPRLWTTFKMNIGRPVSPARLAVAQEWLARSGSFPLSITLKDNDAWRRDIKDYAYVKPVVELINRYSRKWRSLDLDLPLSLLEMVNDSVGAALSLRSLTLGVPPYHREDPEGLEINISQHGLPEDVRLEGIPLRSLTMQWSCVTTVHTEDLVLSEIKKLLRLAPALQEGTFVSTYPPHQSSAFFDTVLLTHRQLEELEFHFNYDNDDDLMDIVLFFDTVRFPNLTSLRCEFFPATIVPQGALATFLRRSSCPLEELSLRGSLSNEGLIEIMQSVPSLNTLSLAVPMNHPPLCTFFDAFARHLQSDSSVDGNSNTTPNDSEPLLPRLQTFHWYRGHAFPWENFLALFAPPSPSTRAAGEARSRLRPLERLTVFVLVGPETPIPYIPKKTLDDLMCVLDDIDYDFELLLSGGRSDWVGVSFDKLKAEDESGVEISSGTT